MLISSKLRHAHLKLAYASLHISKIIENHLGYLTADVTAERATKEKTFLHFSDMKFHDNMLKSSNIATFLNAFSFRRFGKWSWVTGDESGARQMQFNRVLRGQWQSPKSFSFGCLQLRFGQSRIVRDARKKRRETYLSTFQKELQAKTLPHCYNSSSISVVAFMIRNAAPSMLFFVR